MPTLEYFINLLATAILNDDIKSQESLLKTLRFIGIDRQKALTAAFDVIKGETND